MTPKISVIIAVYNVSKYLEKCLWSVTNQTLKDIEIIVVNDGSTDNCLDIIEKFTSIDNRIKLTNKSNGGLVSARKEGLVSATGDYIHHLDGDDYVELNTYELLYNRATKNNSDIVIMRFLYEYENEKSVISEPYPKDEYQRMEFLKYLLRADTYFGVCLHIHKRLLYIENTILFDEDISTGEDAYLTTQLAYYSNKISIVNNPPLYHYLIRSGSITNSKFSDKNAADLRLFPKLIHNFIKSKPEYDELKIHLLALEIHSEVILIYYKKYFKGMHKQSKYSVSVIKNYPSVLELCAMGPFVKLIKVFAINQFLGRLYSRYYIAKGKIK